MAFIRQNWFKIGILVAGVVFVTGILLLMKFQIGLAEEKRLDQLTKQEQDRKDQKEKDDKDYLVKQKQNCFIMYQSESKKFNNVRSWDYNPVFDTCGIIFKDSNPKTLQECTDKLSLYENETDIKTKVIAREDFSYCINGQFINRF